MGSFHLGDGGLGDPRPFSKLLLGEPQILAPGLEQGPTVFLFSILKGREYCFRESERILKNVVLLGSARMMKVSLEERIFLRAVVELLKRKIKEQRITVPQVARRIGLSPVTIYTLLKEPERRTPSFLVVKRLVEVLYPSFGTFVMEAEALARKKLYEAELKSQIENRDVEAVLEDIFEES